MRRVLALVCTSLVLAAAPTYATWTATAVGAGTVRATAVARATAPTVQPLAGRLGLAWAAVTTESGRDVTGYDVVRHVGSTTTTVCSVAASARTCADTAPVAGSAAYGVVARLAGWRGPESPLTTVTFDAAAPTTTMAVSPSPNAAGWSRTAVTVTLTAEDSLAGVDRVSYAVDGGRQVTVAGSTAAFPITGSGEHTVTYAAVDRLGNAEPAVTSTVRIDPDAPITTASTDASLNGAGWSTRPVTVVLTASDSPGSGVKTLTRQVGGGAPVTTARATSSVSLAAEGTNTVAYAATDEADNVEGTRSYTVKVDTVAPVTTATTDPAPNPGGWHSTSPVVLTLSPADATSGVSSLRWRSGTAGTWNTAPSWPHRVPVTVASGSAGTVTVQYQATDVAGNLETVQTSTVRIDRSAPAAPTGLSLSADTGASTTDAVTSTAVQALKGAAEVGATLEVLVDGVVVGTGTVDATGTFSVPMGVLARGTRLVTATAVDEAGNRSPAASLSVKIDQTAPTPAITFPGATTYTSTGFRSGCGTTSVYDVCGTAVEPVTASSSGLASVQLEIRTGTTCLTTGGNLTTAGCATRLTATGTAAWSHTTPLLSTGSYTLSVWATDLAGNTGPVSVAFVRG